MYRYFSACWVLQLPRVSLPWCSLECLWLCGVEHRWLPWTLSSLGDKCTFLFFSFLFFSFFFVLQNRLWCPCFSLKISSPECLRPGLLYLSFGVCWAGLPLFDSIYHEACGCPLLAHLGHLWYAPKPVLFPPVFPPHSSAPFLCDPHSLADLLVGPPVTKQKTLGCLSYLPVLLCDCVDHPNFVKTMRVQCPSLIFSLYSCSPGNN